jgi:orotate phosphoribosyltransferase-like protein
VKEVDLMNDDLRNKINELKELGYGYKRIAKELSMTASAVRYTLAKINEEDLLVGSCKYCGITMKSVKGKKKKVFCSDTCRWQWWNQKHREDKHHGTL